MNDKWFNIGILIVFVSVLVNAFIVMLTFYPGGGFLLQLQNPGFEKNYFGEKYDYSVNMDPSISTAPTNYDGSGFIPIVDQSGNPYGLSPLELVITGVFGLELVLLFLASVFSVFNVVIIGVLSLVLIVKIVVIAYFASIIVRLIFGGRT